MKIAVIGLLLAVTLSGGQVFAVTQSVVIPQETPFNIGRTRIYARKSEFVFKRDKARVKALELVLTLFRGEVFKLVKLGVIQGVGAGDLIKFKPLKPIRVRLKARKAVIRALNRVRHVHLDKLVRGKGLWRQLRHYEFMDLEQKTGKRQ
jgi:hypothetical protein